VPSGTFVGQAGSFYGFGPAVGRMTGKKMDTFVRTVVGMAQFSLANALPQK